MEKPKPISTSLSKRPKKKVARPTKKVAAVAPFNKDAPEHTGRIVKQVVKDKALEARVTALEGAKAPVVVVNIPARPRISQIAIRYDNFGMPINLIPQYSEAEV